MVAIVPVTSQIPVKLSAEDLFPVELFLSEALLLEVHGSIRLRTISNKAAEKCKVKFLFIRFIIQ
jgi:hypothetical protein